MEKEFDIIVVGGGLLGVPLPISWLNARLAAFFCLMEMRLPLRPRRGRPAC